MECLDKRTLLGAGRVGRRVLTLASILSFLSPAGFLAAGPSGATIANPTLINTDAATDSQTNWGQDYAPTVATDRSGNWVAVWVKRWSGAPFGPDTLQVATSTDAGATWSESAPLKPHPVVAAPDCPTVGTDGAGVWLTLWANGTDLVYARSTDNGTGWTDPVLLDDGPVGVQSCPVLAVDEAGNWIVAWVDGFDTHVVHSSDAGLSWDSPVTVPGFRAIELETDGSGTWMMMAGGPASLDSDFSFTRSVDNGATWSHPVALNIGVPDDSYDLWGSRPFASDGRGNWVVMWHYLRPSGQGIRLARSLDGGASWSDVVEVPSLADSAGISVATDRRGRWIATFVLEGDLSIALSNDVGETWTEPERINAEGLWLGSPTILQDGSGNWGVYWVSDDSFVAGANVESDWDLLWVRVAFCDLVAEDFASTAIRMSPRFPISAFDLISGTFSDLRWDRGFSRTTCLGSSDGTSLTDDRPDPSSGDGYYYLTRATSGICASQVYGSSSIEPDPREGLAGFCP